MYSLVCVGIRHELCPPCVNGCYIVLLWTSPNGYCDSWRSMSPPPFHTFFPNRGPLWLCRWNSAGGDGGHFWVPGEDTMVVIATNSQKHQTTQVSLTNTFCMLELQLCKSYSHILHILLAVGTTTMEQYDCVVQEANMDTVGRCSAMIKVFVKGTIAFVKDQLPFCCPHWRGQYSTTGLIPRLQTPYTHK